MSLLIVVSRPAGLRAPNPSATLTHLLAPSSCNLLLRTRGSASLPRLRPSASTNKAVSSCTATRHTAPISTIMSTRGKKRPSAAETVQLAEPQQPSQHTDSDPSSVTSSGLRRSSRRTAARQVTTGKDKGAGTIPNLAQLQKMKGKGKSPRDTAKTMNEQAEDAKEGVAFAMQSLSEMESSFKRDIKRRKLQVEASVFHSGSGQTALFPPRISRESSDVLKVDRLLLTPERDPCDADDQGWEPAMGTEGDAHDGSPEAAVNGAKRPPAVNSDYLPLPWTGRLGYVGDILSREGRCGALD